VAGQAHWPGGSSTQDSLKLNIYKTAVLSVFLYDCDTSAMTLELELIIKGVKRITRVPNEVIYEQTDMKSL
jgi:hypothetical protein